MPFIHVKIGSKSYDIPVRDEMVSHVQSLANYLNEKAQKIEPDIKHISTDPDYLILLSCLTLADELWEEKEKNQKKINHLEALLKKNPENETLVQETLLHERLEKLAIQAEKS